jgi:hypothetical protein
MSGKTLNYHIGKTTFNKVSSTKRNLGIYLKKARVAQADTSLSQAALEQARIRQVAQAWSSCFKNENVITILNITF